MRKLISILGSGAAVLLMVPTGAFAATISNPLFTNGDTTINATGGSTVSGTFTLTVGAGEVVEWLRSQADTYPFTDTSVGGTLGYQEGVYTNVPFSVKVPPNTGTYNANEQGAGTFGGIRSINGGDNVVVGPSVLGTIRVVANASSGSTDLTSSDLQSQIDSLTQSVSTLADMFKNFLKGNTNASTTTASKPACPPLYTGFNASFVQDWLINNGYAAPFTAIGVTHSTGFWGNVSSNAYTQASNACK